MAVSTKPFQTEQAPCGRVVAGERCQAEDEEGLLTDEVSYSCGCHRIRELYHDGSAHVRVVRHDGKVLVDEMTGEHGA
jgi:hypothetical protein